MPYGRGRGGPQHYDPVIQQPNPAAALELPGLLVQVPGLYIRVEDAATFIRAYVAGVDATLPFTEAQRGALDDLAVSFDHAVVAEEDKR